MALLRNNLSGQMRELIALGIFSEQVLGNHHVGIDRAVTLETWWHVNIALSNSLLFVTASLARRRVE
jgi:hypothetical protein